MNLFYVCLVLQYHHLFGYLVTLSPLFVNVYTPLKQQLLPENLATNLLNHMNNWTIMLLHIISESLSK